MELPRDLEREGLALRRPVDGGWLAFARAMERVFHETTADAELERWGKICPQERFLAVTDETGGIVATSGSHVFRISVPGGASIGCAGVTAVTVRTDHRRRGLLRAMMDQLFADAIEAQEPVAALYASEARIYGRFGFGLSAPADTLTIDAAALRTVGGDPGLVQLVDHDDAPAALAPILDAVRGLRAGLLDRDDALWQHWFGAHRDKDRDGEYGPRWIAVVPGRGYAVYRVKDGDWANRRPNATLQVTELLATDRAAEAALWAFLGTVDLVTTVVFTRAPTDTPLRWLVDDETMVSPVPAFPLYLRVLDMPTALTARTYRHDDTVVLEVADEQVAANRGRWRLSVEGGSATCERTDDHPDATLDVAVLGSLYLGGVSTVTLRDAGRLIASPEVADRLDRMFRAARAPLCTVDF